MSDQKPPISNDLSLYADEIDEMLAQRDQIKAEQERAKRERLAQNGRKARQQSAPLVEEAKEEAPKTMADLSGGQYGHGAASENLRKMADEKLNYLNTVSREEEHNKRLQELQQHNRSNGAGFVPINIEDLPTKGLFYPVGTKIFAKAASLGEIKNWSLIDETDLSAVDAGINSIIESCVNIVFPNDYGTYGTWRDLKEVDRLYIVLAVHDFTFPQGAGNDIKIVINETEDVIVNKDKIEFVKFSDKLMKYYNPDKLCFSFPAKSKCFKDGFFHVYIPSVGVTKWVKEYMQSKIRTQQGFDQSFITVAPLLIASHKGLNTDTYYDLIDSTAEWSAYEWALVSKVKANIESSITPKIHYKDEGGVEKEAPLHFRGGVKAIFQPNVDIDL